LATHALKGHNLAQAEGLYAQLAEHKVAAGDEAGAAAAHRQLGTVAQERCDWGAAERW
jgi:hypothetical protein